MTYDMQGSCIFMHGAPKVGKTTVASSFPGPIVWYAAERGHKYLQGGPHTLFNITSKDDFRGACSLAAIQRKSKEVIGKAVKPKTIIVDPIQNVYDFYKSAICGEYGAEVPADKGNFSLSIWDKIGTIFLKDMTAFVSMCVKLNVTIIFLSHTRNEEIDLGTHTVEKVVAKVSGQVRHTILPLADHMWFLGYGSSKRVTGKNAIDNFQDSRTLVTRGGDLVEAGCRDPKVERKLITDLQVPDFENKTGGYWQIVKELDK